MTRPPVANIDQLIVVTSVCDPSPNTLLIDEAIAAAEDKEIEPVVVVSKTDLESGEWLRDIYEKAGIPFFAVSSVTDERDRGGQVASEREGYRVYRKFRCGEVLPVEPH